MRTWETSFMSAKHRFCKQSFHCPKEGENTVLQEQIKRRPSKIVTNLYSRVANSPG